MNDIIRLTAFVVTGDQRARHIRATERESERASERGGRPEKPAGRARSTNKIYLVYYLIE